MEEYDYILVVDDPDTGVRRLHEIIRAAHSMPSSSKEFIRAIRGELERGE